MKLQTIRLPFRTAIALFVSMSFFVGAPMAANAATKKAPPKPAKKSTKAFCAAIKKWQGVEIAFLASKDLDYVSWMERISSPYYDAYKAAPNKKIQWAVISVGRDSLGGKFTLDQIQSAVNANNSPAMKQAILNAESFASGVLDGDSQAQGRILNNYVISTCKFDMFGPIAAAIGGVGPVLDANDVPINPAVGDPTNTLVP
jgi:hypothetical protein